jgi:hypothetical protein
LLAYNTAELATSTQNLKYYGYCQVHGNLRILIQVPQPSMQAKRAYDKKIWGYKITGPE